MTDWAPAPSTGTSVGDADCNVSLAYEQLRQNVLASSPSAKPLGLVILLREGVLGWLQRRGTCAGPVEPAPTLAPTGRSTPCVVPVEIQAGLVRVLASMALGSVNQEQRA